MHENITEYIIKKYKNNNLNNLNKKILIIEEQLELLQYDKKKYEIYFVILKTLKYLKKIN